MQSTISQQLSVIINREPQLSNDPGMALLEGSAASATKGEHLRAIGHVTEVVEDAAPFDGSDESCHDALPQPEERPSLSANNQGQCVPWCSCRCHVRQNWKTPWALETLIGRIHVSYSGKRPDCNEIKCQRTSTAAPFTVTHQLPRYLMNRYLFLSMRYTPRDGPNFALRAPRITSWSHLFWNYANSGDLQAIQNMFAQGKASPFDLNPHGSNVLWYSAAQKDCRLTKFMIEQGADPNLSNGVGQAVSTRLWDYSFSGRYGDESISIVTNMLKDTDYTETRGFSTLHKIVLGVLARDLHDMLEDSTASVNVGDALGRTPLHWATIRDDLKSVKALVTAGADPNVTDHFGTSSLGYVISSAVCSVLLNAGAWTDIRNYNHDRTALHIHCSSYGEGDVIDLLLQAGITVDVRTTDDETPLLNAIYWHMTAAAKRLIELGADVNAKNISSRDHTLHFAVNYDHWEIIPLLLAKCVDYKAFNIRRRNIAHLAAISGSTATISTLVRSNLVRSNLVRSNLVGLDFELKDVDGKTPADHMREREIFAEKEKGVFEAFEAFQRSVKAPDAMVEQVEKQ